MPTFNPLAMILKTVLLKVISNITGYIRKCSSIFSNVGFKANSCVTLDHDVMFSKSIAPVLKSHQVWSARWRPFNI